MSIFSHQHFDGTSNYIQKSHWHFKKMRKRLVEKWGIKAWQFLHNGNKIWATHCLSVGYNKNLHSLANSWHPASPCIHCFIVMGFRLCTKSHAKRIMANVYIVSHVRGVLPTVYSIHYPPTHYQAWYSWQVTSHGKYDGIYHFLGR